ncbi:hypothetical protein [Janibacter corallicola]|uniref:hypothetical protein n=1 Tax=Janibacter corallicola TaxID=415212 RepID=UPI000AC2ABFB|nr:hypothetical protein [Janibacter corallicola]
MTRTPFPTDADSPVSAARADDLPSLFHAELTRYRSLIERLARAASTPASPSTTIANIYEAREQAQMAVHVAHRLINGRFEGSGQVGRRWLDAMDVVIAEVHAAKWELGRADGSLTDFAAPATEPDLPGLLARFRALTLQAIEVARASVSLEQPAQEPSPAIRRQDAEVATTTDGIPLVPTICPVVVLAGSNREMGRQYARQVIDIYGTWIFERLTERTVDPDTEGILSEWEQQLSKHAPEILDFAEGWAEGAMGRGVPMTREQAIAVWTGYRPPADRHVMFGEDLDSTGRIGVNTYSGAHVSPAGEIADMCSGFCAWAEATTDGELVAGSTTDHDCTYQATIVAFPDVGNSFIYTPFSANGSIPGLGRFYMAGHPGFNNKGVAYVHHGGQGIDGASCGGGPPEEWGYGIRRGASTFHALQFASSAAEARDMMLAFPVGDPGPILGTAGGLWADAHYGVAIEERAGSPAKPNPILRDTTSDSAGNKHSVLYANNNPLSQDSGVWRGPREGRYSYTTEAGWFITRSSDAGTSDPALIAARMSSKNSAARNRYFHRVLRHEVGGFDVEALTRMYRTSGDIPEGPYEESVESWSAGTEWDASAAHRGNAFTAVIAPSSTRPGEYRACIGPADRFLQVREPSHGYYYYDETNEFWSLHLTSDPTSLLADATAEASRRVHEAQVAHRDAPASHADRYKGEEWLIEAEECLDSASRAITRGTSGRQSHDDLAQLARDVRAACRSQVRAAQVIRLWATNGRPKATDPTQ